MFPNRFMKHCWRSSEAEISKIKVVSFVISKYMPWIGEKRNRSRPLPNLIVLNAKRTAWYPYCGSINGHNIFIRKKKSTTLLNQTDFQDLLITMYCSKININVRLTSKKDKISKQLIFTSGHFSNSCMEEGPKSNTKQNCKIKIT
jgi:hypothetical protein